ncbi:MAG: hypothetical protein C0512_16010 [Flavobacterium sp.]|nr:hypothetical protein [Flavobacterium sp.]
MKSVLCTSQRWNKIANTNSVWVKIAEKLPIPTKIDDRHLKHYPEWKIYNETGCAKEKVKHFLLNSKTVFLSITDEILEHNFNRPFTYKTGIFSFSLFADGLWPDSITLGDYQIPMPSPFSHHYDASIPICVQDQQGHPIEYFPNRVQYFYLLNRDQYNKLYWIYNGIFYRIVCSQQSPTDLTSSSSGAVTSPTSSVEPCCSSDSEEFKSISQHSIHNKISEKNFSVVLDERINDLIKRKLINSINIENKENILKEVHFLIDYIGISYDKRWIRIHS